MSGAPGGFAGLANVTNAWVLAFRRRLLGATLFC